MKSAEKTCKELAHLEYLRTVLDERLAVIQQEAKRCQAEQQRLQDDKYAAKKDTRKLAEFFWARGLFIVNLQTGARTQDQYALAKQLWRARAVCLPFIKALSRNKEASFVYPKQPLSPTETTDIKNLCDTLKKHGYLAYAVRPDGFEISPSLKGTQKYFLSGSWAEEVTLYLIDKALKKFAQKHSLGHRLFWDVKLKRIDSDKDNSHDMQLDLVAEVEDRFYIFETKSGFVLSIDKWVDRTRLFDDGKNRFITCTADDKLNPLIFKPFRLFALQTLEEQFTGVLQEDFIVSASPGKGAE
jgi:uncharacterized small protein (DUF1192 family)